MISISRLEQIDEYLYASGKAVTQQDHALLEEYDRLVAARYCRPGCGGCLGRCPHGVPIDDILRYEMYAENNGRQKWAMLLHSGIPPGRSAERCLACDAPCSGACAFGIAIRERLGMADRALRWS